MNCVTIGYFCAFLFPVDLVTKRAIIGGGQKSVFSSFLTDFSAREHGLLKADTCLSSLSHLFLAADTDYRMLNK